MIDINRKKIFGILIGVILLSSCAIGKLFFIDAAEETLESEMITEEELGETSEELPEELSEADISEEQSEDDIVELPKDNLEELPNEQQEIAESADDEGISGQDTAGSQPIEINSYTELKKAVEQGTGEINIILTADIGMTSGITVGQDKKLTIDGQNQYTIEQKIIGGIFLGQARSVITLKNVNVIGRTQYGIVWHQEQNGTAIYDNMTYNGPQPYYSSGSNGHLIIRNGGTFEIKKQTEGVSANAEEFSENARVTFDGGKTVITHALNGVNTCAVFFIVHGTERTGAVKVINQADVEIRSGNYILYTDIGAVAFEIEDGSRLNVMSAGFNLNTGHPIGNLTVGEDAYFSYVRTGTPYTDSMRSIRIAGDLTVGKGSIFLYDSPIGIYTMGRVILNEPEVVSIYGTESAFASLQNDWIVSNVNAVNYWTKASGMSPSEDSAIVWPDYMWNTWSVTDRGTTKIGEQFSFAGSGAKGVYFGGEVTDALGRSQETLAQVFTLRLAGAPKRIVIGNIDPFEVERLSTSSENITGTAKADDVAVRYQDSEGSELVLQEERFPLAYGEQEKPKSGSDVQVTANLYGLRAGMVLGTQGELALISAPQKIYYGEHEIAPVTTVYERLFCDSEDEQGRMLVRIEDTRGEESTPWNLAVEVSDQVIEGKNLLPASLMVFVTGAGKELNLGNGAVIVHSQAQKEKSEYEIVWEHNQGLLVKSVPGALEPGEYAAVINWSVQITPDSE